MDNDIMTVVTFTEVDRDLDYPSITDNLTEAKLTAFVNAREEIENWITTRTKLISERRWPKHQAWFSEFDSYQVTLEYNDSCHCHPTYAALSFPISWLFTENWQELIDAKLSKERQAQQAKDDANNAIKEKQEREQLARLQAKFKESK